MPLRAESRSPELIRPMPASPGRLPTGSEWAFEFKWDGVRAVTYVRGGRVRAMTRNNLEVSATYPEVRALSTPPGDHEVVLDGGIVALGAHRQPDFGRLQSRMHVARPGDELPAHVPVAYYVFDLLHVDGRSLLGVPYSRRREELAALGLGDVPGVRVPPSSTGVDGEDVLAVAADHGLEGVFAKRVGSGYEPGRRSTAWVKVSLVRTQEVLIGGWRPDHARRAHWVRPELVGEVEYRAWTTDGRLRHSSWRGLRPDKDPDDVRRP